jgi:hypothetical protein
MSAVAMADISITGDAKYEYDHSETSAGVKSNTANTEMHINFAGKTGDTGVVAKFELDTSGDNGAGIDLEDMYMTTKVGDINIKAGNWASGTGGLLGELENGGRAQNKIDLSTTVSGVTIYAGNSDKASSEASNEATLTTGTTTVTTASGTAAAITSASLSQPADAADGDTLLNGNMYAGARMTVAGNTIEFKKNSDTRDSYGIKGSLQGVNYRYEAMDDTTSGDATYIELDTTVSGLKLQYAAIDTDSNSLVDESDSGVFAVSFSDAAKVATSATEQKQFAVSTSIDGTTVTVKSGEITKGVSSTKDLDYTQFQAKRKLASGATAVVTYTDRDQITTGGSNKNLEIELNVAF